VLGISDPSFARLAGRLAARDALDALVAAWTREREPEEVARVLQEAGVSAMSVVHGEALRDDPHLTARDALPTVTHPDMGPTRHSGNPIRFSRTPMATAGPAPRLGEHTVDVLARWLGIDAAEAQKLVDDGTCR
jgi:crotonobetainyl-CoA:carnitine CoA-transferase CaiB-like acyl-CoA transferase